MEKVLNQDEIDALFHAARDRAPDRGHSKTENRHVTACNFRHVGQILRLMPPNEKVLSLSYEIRLSELNGTLVTAFPAVAANALIRKLAQQGSDRKRRAGFAEASALRERLEKCSFPVELILPGGTVSSQQLLALEKGSIVVLNLRVDKPAVLYVEKQALFSAQPVRSGTRRAGQILQKIGSSDSRRSEKIEQ
jgi:flagellar motor switch protein FliM